MTPEVLLTGTKIMTMSVNNIKFLDSLNFLPMPLAKLPKTLNIASNLMKGFFLHFFNTFCKPRIMLCYYCRKSFMGMRSCPIMNRKNLNHGMMNKKCCHLIYRKGLRCILKMMYTFYEEHAWYFPLFMKSSQGSRSSDTIGILLPGGYRWLDHQSHVAVMWMVGEEKERGAAIPYEGNGREVWFMGRKVDRLAKEGIVTNVFCFLNGRDKAITNTSSEMINTRFESTMAKQIELLYSGCRLVEI
ncbi:hypothetical protein J437_LFUL019719 [Ladona fulva]|nr:hypothetical protein J437_LFUL019719 [Ladona fulva]